MSMILHIAFLIGLHSTITANFEGLTRFDYRNNVDAEYRPCIPQNSNDEAVITSIKVKIKKEESGSVESIWPRLYGAIVGLLFTLAAIIFSDVSVILGGGIIVVGFNLKVLILVFGTCIGQLLFISEYHRKQCMKEHNQSA